MTGRGVGVEGRLEDYNALKEIIKDLVKKEAKVLVLGCGNAGRLRI